METQIPRTSPRPPSGTGKALISPRERTALTLSITTPHMCLGVAVAMARVHSGETTVATFRQWILPEPLQELRAASLPLDGNSSFPCRDKVSYASLLGLPWQNTTHWSLKDRFLDPVPEAGSPGPKRQSPLPSEAFFFTVWDIYLSLYISVPMSLFYNVTNWTRETLVTS